MKNATFENVGVFIREKVWLDFRAKTIRLWRWNWQSVPKRRHIKFRRQGITQKKVYNMA